MNESRDVIVIGGAVIGSAVAYYLTANPDFTGTVLVVERDPTYATASTALSSSSIRTQFSNEINVRISQYGFEVIQEFSSMMAAGDHRPDLNFHPGGYLFMARTKEGAETLREKHRVQRACGADVVLWTADELAHAFPHLRVDDILLASYGLSGEGWFDNMGMMQGFKARARAQGTEYLADEVVAIDHDGQRANSVTLKSGRQISAGWIVNASGPRAALTARMAGLDIPVEPRKRTSFVFDCARSPEGSARINDGRLPLMVDVSGVYCRPEGRYFLTGAPPHNDVAVDPDDFEPRYEEFEDIIWPALAARSAAFEAIKPVNQWAGHYAFNILDHNMILGPHPQMPNFIFANGFSGHGLQQAPATGRGVSELIIYEGFHTLDLSELGFERVLENQPFLEKVII